MPMCEKCGAHYEEGMKFCEKCGSEIAVQEIQDAPQVVAENIIENDVENVVKGEATRTKVSTGGIMGMLEGLLSHLPHPFTKPGDRTALMIGLGSLGVLALTYLICFFAFMAEICLPVSMGVLFEYMGSLGSIAEGASPIWIIAYFVFNLSPVFLAVYTFLNKKFRVYGIFAAAFLFVLTLFSFIVWLICAPATFIEAIDSYRSAGSIAWYVFMDALSEVWYVKMLLSLAAVFGLGVDYLVNKGN